MTLQGRTGSGRRHAEATCNNTGHVKSLVPFDVLGCMHVEPLKYLLLWKFLLTHSQIIPPLMWPGGASCTASNTPYYRLDAGSYGSGSPLSILHVALKFAKPNSLYQR